MTTEPDIEEYAHGGSPREWEDEYGQREPVSTSNPHPTPDPLSAQPGFDLAEARAERDRLAADLADAMQEIARWMRKSERVRGEVAEEIARAIEAEKPSARNFWDTADVARVYALNHAAKVARRYAAAPTEPSVGASVVSAEGSGHPQPATAAHGLAGNGRMSTLCVIGEDGCAVEGCMCRCHNRRPILSLDTAEGATNANP